ncbi:hypothetical protein IHE45_11G058000 [Dioscorea alata]|uniref:Uncharacterized protein n=1 Tax=Dioscorea alata TaxID=55571 RepID=A0ACB7V6W4_DIOAL|nr:hypothetical protein IHE45_11G058000 [Dioscorea alata]
MNVVIFSLAVAVRDLVTWLSTAPGKDRWSCKEPLDAGESEIAMESRGWRRRRGRLLITFQWQRVTGLSLAKGRLSQSPLLRR